MKLLEHPSGSLRIASLALIALLLAVSTTREAQAQVFDDQTYSFFLFDRLEYAPGPSERPIGVEATGWIGGDLNRLWLRAEGEQSTADGFDGEGEVELEALYGRLVTPFFDAVGGARLDTRWGEATRSRAFLAAGLQGMAPYGLEIEPTLYVSHEGDVSAELAAAYHFLFTQRLILEPELELGVAVQDVPAWGVGSGVNDLGLGLRLRYEISRKFAPYVGYAWDWTFGETADLARRAGAETREGMLVFGIRMWR